ncbi:MAG: hypothetical protein U1E02_31845, partial [Hydrogenophaga sp.]|nr:hypothetical protein [Hydrogenophaga sp.]
MGARAGLENYFQRPTENSMDQHTDTEKRHLQMARDFYDKVLNGMQIEALARYVAVDHIQHAPAAADGV